MAQLGGIAGFADEAILLGGRQRSIAARQLHGADALQLQVLSPIHRSERSLADGFKQLELAHAPARSDGHFRNLAQAGWLGLSLVRPRQLLGKVGSILWK